MAKPNPDNPAARALSFPQRILLFCVGSGTEWERTGITGPTVTAMVIKGRIGRAAGKLTLTEQGRAVLAALLMEEDE
jgi:hypothetical protein